jgi:hypothetical protein
MNEYACRAGGGRGCVARTLRSVASLVLACSYADPQVYVRSGALSRGRSAQAGKNAMHGLPLDYCPAQRKKKRPRLDFSGRGRWRQSIVGRYLIGSASIPDSTTRARPSYRPAASRSMCRANAGRCG